MSWLRLLRRGGGASDARERIQGVRLTLEGWAVDGDHDQPGARVWRDSVGAVLALDAAPAHVHLPIDGDESGYQQFCRRLAESRRAGLIEARLSEGPLGRIGTSIFKQSQDRGHLYIGHLWWRQADGFLVWTIMDGEHGTTGVREAVVTRDLLNADELTIEGYERSWAADPYDPDYRGVDRGVLRFISDDERYDEQFPDHPLSKLRRVLAALPHSIQVEPRSSAPGQGATPSR